MLFFFPPVFVVVAAFFPAEKNQIFPSEWWASVLGAQRVDPPFLGFQEGWSGEAVEGAGILFPSIDGWMDDVFLDLFLRTSIYIYIYPPPTQKKMGIRKTCAPCSNWYFLRSLWCFCPANLGVFGAEKPRSRKKVWTVPEDFLASTNSPAKNSKDRCAKWWGGKLLASVFSTKIWQKTSQKAEDLSFIWACHHNKRHEPWANPTYSCWNKKMTSIFVELALGEVPKYSEHSNFFASKSRSFKSINLETRVSRSFCYAWTMQKWKLCRGNVGWTQQKWMMMMMMMMMMMTCVGRTPGWHVIISYI